MAIIKKFNERFQVHLQLKTLNSLLYHRVLKLDNFSKFLVVETWETKVPEKKNYP